MTKQQLEALRAYIEFRVEFKVSEELGRDCDHLWCRETKEGEALAKAFEEPTP